MGIVLSTENGFFTFYRLYLTQKTNWNTSPKQTPERRRKFSSQHFIFISIIKIIISFWISSILTKVRSVWLKKRVKTSMFVIDMQVFRDTHIKWVFLIYIWRALLEKLCSVCATISFFVGVIFSLGVLTPIFICYVRNRSQIVLNIMFDTNIDASKPCFVHVLKHVHRRLRAIYLFLIHVLKIAWKANVAWNLFIDMTIILIHILYI